MSVKTGQAEETKPSKFEMYIKICHKIVDGLQHSCKSFSHIIKRSKQYNQSKKIKCITIYKFIIFDFESSRQRWGTPISVESFCSTYPDIDRYHPRTHQTIGNHWSNIALVFHYKGFPFIRVLKDLVWESRDPVFMTWNNLLFMKRLTNHRESKNVPAATEVLSESNLGDTGKFNA